MHGLEIVTLIGVLILAGTALADRLRLPPPLVLLALGGVVGFLPGAGGAQMPPEVVLFLFLPPLLYWEAVTISLREMRANLRAIVLTATVLVLVTAGTVAVVAHAIGLSWPMAFVLGAVLAPTDATAVSTVAALLPRRARTVLQAESLVNDGTALVIYAVAVGVAVGGLDAGPLGVAWRLGVAYAGGIALGLAVALLVLAVQRRLHDTRLNNVLSVLTCFLAYLPAELLHASGVVAVVTCGLTLSRVSSRLGSARARVQARGFWTLSTFVLNGSLFVLIGLQLHAVVEGRTATAIWAGAAATGLIALTVTTTRLVCTNTLEHLVRVVDRRPAQRLGRVPFRARLPVQWAGFRGAVSLAAALAVPTRTVEGIPLEGRDTVLLVTFGVIAVLLVVHGLTLPTVIRLSRVPQDPAEDRERKLAETTATAAAAAVLSRRAAELDVPETVLRKVRDGYESALHRQDTEDVLATRQAGDTDVPTARMTVLDEAHAEQALLLALLGDEREAVARLRDDDVIDDVVMRRAQHGFDAEEVRLLGGETDT